MPAVRITAHGWGWRHAGRKAWAVRDLDLTIEPGERVMLLGASGAGKSTLIHALAGVLGGDDEGDQRGDLLLDGRSPVAARGRAGLLLQDPDSQVILAKVGDDVAFGLENLGVSRDQIWGRVDEALDAVGLNLPRQHPTSALSGGQKQRLALAGVLAMRPGLLLLDEPTANLDAEGVLEVRDTVARVLEQTNSTFVVIEHRVEVWRSLVNRVIVLSADGGVLADGHPDVVLTGQGESLAAAGVWVPEHPPANPRHDWVAGQTLLEAHGLAIGRRAGALVSSGIDLSIAAGSATVISGANGSGKSTLGLTIGGLLPALAGEVDAREALRSGAGRHPIRWKSRELLTRIGTVFQEPEHQFLTTTVRRELEIGPRTLGLPDEVITTRVDDLLQRLNLAHLALANPFTLSGGEKRRLSVASVLATRPSLLILDEPTFGQDSRTWQELVALLAELMRLGTAVVAITHDRHLIDAIADQEVRL